MAREASPDIARRDEEIARLYVNDVSLTVPDLATQFGLSKDSIKRILKSGEVELRPSTGNVPLVNVKPLSQGHKNLGHKVNMHLVLGHMSVSEMATECRISEKRINLLLLGGYDITLSELQRLSEVIDLDLQEDLQPQPH